MPVFKCATCGRFLHRPDNLFGSAWQCPTCGPIVVEKTVAASAPLARLLERECRLSCSASPDLEPCTCRSCGRLLFRPADLEGSAWQCHVCGPTFVAPVTAFTAMLRKVYLLQQAGSPPQTASRFVLHGELGSRVTLAAILFGILMTTVSFAVVYSKPEDHPFLVWGVAVFVVLAALLLIFFVLDVRNLFRQRKFTGVHSRFTSGLPASLIDWPAAPKAANEQAHLLRRETISQEPPAADASILSSPHPPTGQDDTE
jgi:hypothetical protein